MTGRAIFPRFVLTGELRKVHRSSTFLSGFQTLIKPLDSSWIGGVEGTLDLRIRKQAVRRLRASPLLARARVLGFMYGSFPRSGGCGGVFHVLMFLGAILSK